MQLMMSSLLLASGQYFVTSALHSLARSGPCAYTDGATRTSPPPNTNAIAALIGYPPQEFAGHSRSLRDEIKPHCQVTRSEVSPLIARVRFAPDSHTTLPLAPPSTN